MIAVTLEHRVSSIVWCEGEKMGGGASEHRGVKAPLASLLPFHDLPL